jgi:two-component system cell cycle sensor histidine kinase/response regulator CckA
MLSRQMLAYSGRARFSTELLHLSEAAGELVELLAASIPKHVRVETDLPEALPRVEVDPTQIRQVIMNLVTNAAEAIGQRPGTVRIAAVREAFDPGLQSGLVLGAELTAGDYVQLSVSDDGEGMTAHTRARLFDPFFTTKGSGRGLGLAAVLGIVRAHHGALHVTSQQGFGTTFRIWLPVAQDTRPAVTREARSEPPPALDAGASERASTSRATHVLVVDDEPIVRMATHAVLDSFDFDVTTVESGDLAVEVVRLHETVDVVLLDVTMPGLPVAATHAAIRELRPKLPIVLTSGFSEQEVIDQLLALPATAFLPKPYSAQDLVDMLQAMVRR